MQGAKAFMDTGKNTKPNRRDLAVATPNDWSMTKVFHFPCSGNTLIDTRFELPRPNNRVLVAIVGVWPGMTKGSTVRCVSLFNYKNAENGKLLPYGSLLTEDIILAARRFLPNGNGGIVSYDVEDGELSSEGYRYIVHIWERSIQERPRIERD
jgi:hypothetical protein